MNQSMILCPNCGNLAYWSSYFSAYICQTCGWENRSNIDPARSGRKGLIQVYTGEGKGKTTAAIGAAIRAIGHGWLVSFIQFLKGRSSGELLVSKYILPNLKIKQFGSPEFISRPTSSDMDVVRAGLSVARDDILSGNYDLVVLDEISWAINLGILSVDEVIDIVKLRKQWVEIILTGRSMPQPILDIADLISEIQCIRHPYGSGISARKGIEY